MLNKIISLEEDIKMDLIGKTNDEELSNFIAMEVMHTIMKSNIVKDEAKEAYRDLK